jgi:hypothetical protein
MDLMHVSALFSGGLERAIDSAGIFDKSKLDLPPYHKDERPTSKTSLSFTSVPQAIFDGARRGDSIYEISYSLERWGIRMGDCVYMNTDFHQIFCPIMPVAIGLYMAEESDLINPELRCICFSHDGLRLPGKDYRVDQYFLSPAIIRLTAVLELLDYSRHSQHEMHMRFNDVTYQYF